MFQIEVYWEGKWRKLFTGAYKDLLEYKKQCTKVETRIVPVPEKKR